MIVKRQTRPKKRPLPKNTIDVRFMGETVKVPKAAVIPFRDDYTEEEFQATEPKPHQLRKIELARIHGIRENDIFVDPNNGVELYRTSTGTWATSPGY